MFTFYLANALKDMKNEKLLPKHLTDHSYTDELEPNKDIDQQFADDLSWLNNSREMINSIKTEVTETLKKNL